MKTRTILPLAIAMTAALSQPVFADLVQNIVLTENSSTGLTATWNGSSDPLIVTVLNTGVDQWTVTIALTGAKFDQLGGGVGWIEPENSLNGNILTSPLGNNQLFIVSDTLGHPGDHSDGSRFRIGTFFSSFNGVVTPLPIDATFNDNAATSEPATVPETGSTFGLLFLSLVALLGTSRVRFLRLA